MNGTGKANSGGRPPTPGRQCGERRQAGSGLRIPGSAPAMGDEGGIEAYRQTIPSGASRCRRRTEWSGQRGGAKGDKKGQCAGRSGGLRWGADPPGHGPCVGVAAAPILLAGEGESPSKAVGS